MRGFWKRTVAVLLSATIIFGTGMTTQGTTFTDTKASKTDWTYYWVYPYHKNGGQMIVGGTAKYTYGKAK